MTYARIATIGPGTDNPAMWTALVDAGATRFRLNTSHMTPDEVEETVTRIRRARIRAMPDEPTPYRDGDTNLRGTREIPIVLDLQGSKWRLGELEAMELVRGEPVEFVVGTGDTEYTDTPSGDAVRRLPVPHPDFFTAAASGNGTIRLNDARVELSIERVGPDHLACTVRRGGPASSRKGVSLPGATYRREGLLPQDAEIIGRLQGEPGITCALSYVRDAVEMERFHRVLGGGGHAIAKIERPEAVAAADEIANHAGEIWFCRGDLGAETGLCRLADLYSAFSRLVRVLPVPVILAGQVLEHMTRSPEPTRSEVCHLADILAAGYSGIVLSDETAVGDFPLESCRTSAMFDTGRADTFDPPVESTFDTTAEKN
jgi:pyruvate kinase